MLDLAAIKNNPRIEDVDVLVAELARIRAEVEDSVKRCCDSTQYGRSWPGFCESFGCSSLMELIDPTWVYPESQPEDPDDGSEPEED